MLALGFSCLFACLVGRQSVFHIRIIRVIRGSGVLSPSFWRVIDASQNAFRVKTRKANIDA